MGYLYWSCTPVMSQRPLKYSNLFPLFLITNLNLMVRPYSEGIKYLAHKTWKNQVGIDLTCFIFTGLLSRCWKVLRILLEVKSNHSSYTAVNPVSSIIMTCLSGLAHWCNSGMKISLYNLYLKNFAFIKEVSLCSGQWLAQKLTTDQNAEQVRHLYHTSQGLGTTDKKGAQRT